ncbi:hypothetical protein [Mycetocola zhadangensis]|uniref:hypothetical protein n=1 Tax=Mycetocola zhadangensis TaxID=1164595 RepID=UPI0011C3EAA4|nr:hypothetical protein [Mycetocola zhadangensis]
MSVFIEVRGERFRVDTRTDPFGRQAVDFTWLNGPEDGTYGFTVAPGGGEHGPGAEGSLTRTQIEQEATNFVLAFFSEGGIGPSDFPDFLLMRRRL